MKILVTFITDRFSVLQAFWKRQKANSNKTKFYGADKSEELDIGGLICIIDWKVKKIIKKKRLRTPSGFDNDKNNFYINTCGNSVSVLSKKLLLKKRIINPFLNDIHSININKTGSLLITSTGLDAIVEIDEKGKKLFSWFATDHGYNIDPKRRKREINKKINHRYKKYPTLKQTTHLNSALFIGKTKHYRKTIYCSLFHQGKIMAINKTTGESKVVLKNLNHPHAIYRINKKLILSDTENNKIIISDLNFENIKKIKLKGVNWVQDTSILNNRNLLVCDANNNRIIEINPITKRQISIFNYNKEWRIYQAKQIK